ncbi:MAG: RHS repeat-associated core domain-containing protein, partial [Kofleriaceae bacterium]|nr:RHS repeat-associated core domain-containing protein [Kofleriaceae bacterium]
LDRDACATEPGRTRHAAWQLHGPAKRTAVAVKRTGRKDCHWFAQRLHWIYKYDRNGNETSEEVPRPSSTDPILNYTASTVYDHLDRPQSRVIGPRTLSVADQNLFGANTETFSWDFSTANGKGRLYQWRSFGVTGAQVQQHLYFTDPQAQPHLTAQLFTAAGYSNLNRSAREEWSPLGTRMKLEHRELIGTNQYETWTRTRLDGRGLPSSLEIVSVNTVGGTSSSRIAGEQTRNVAGLVTKRRNNTSGSMVYVEANWSYDKLGRVVNQQVQKVETIPIVGTTTTQVARQQLSYFGNDDPKTLFHTLGSSTRTFNYGYDQRHQITSALVSGGAFYSGSYGYGPAGRLASANVSQVSPKPFGSEVMPRNVNYVYGGTDPEHVTSLVTAQGVTVASYAYDAAGNQTSRSYPGTGESWTYVYDGKDQLRRAIKLVNNVEQGREEYWYDNNGQRTQVVKLPVGGNKSLIWFLKDTEYHFDASGALTKTYAHASLGTPVARIERTPASSAGTFEYQFHGLASNTLAAVSSTGTINARFSYGPFGEVLEATDAGGASAGIAVHKRRFNDKYQDDISALTYYGFRYYDKVSLTWTQSDPLFRFAPDAAWTKPRQGLLYTANLNNPLRYVDPDGRQPYLGGMGDPGIGAVKAGFDSLMDSGREAGNALPDALIAAGDVIGNIPGIDGAGDFLSGTGYAMKGQYGMALMSFAAMAITTPGAGKVGREVVQEVAEQGAKHTHELQAIADAARAPLSKDAKADSLRTVTINRHADGQLSATGSVKPNPKQREALAAQGVTDVPTHGKSNRLPGKTGHHGEQRGIAYGEATGNPVVEQASSSGAKHGGKACAGCAAAQESRRINNVTGKQ